VHASGQGPHIDVTNWFLLIVVMVFSATLTASLGLYLGTVVDPRKVQMIFAVVLLPLTMLALVGGTLVFGTLAVRTFRNRVVG
jgi:ABC-2 type transport system permease protein